MNLDPVLQEKLIAAESICVSTGAGISAESGVPTFRGKDGIWQKMQPAELASIDGFLANPELVWEWYQWRRDIVNKVEPNAGHFALAELERKVPHFTLATQNVDNLHRRAGSQNVLELHGNITRNFCNDCKKEFAAVDTESVPRCDCGGMIRPGVVWFGEMLPEDAINGAMAAARTCDVFLCVGSSSIVYPAASLPMIAQDAGAYLIEVNPEPTDLSPLFDQCLRGKAGEILPALAALRAD